MDSVKKALNKGFDKATNPKDEPQVLNKSSSSSQSQSHALNINPNLTDRHPLLTGSGGGGFDQQHHRLVGETTTPLPPGQRNVGSTGAGISTSDRRAMNQHARDMGYGPGTQPCYSGTEPQLGLHTARDRGSVGSVGSFVGSSAESVGGAGVVEGVGMGMQSHGRYEHRQPSLQEQKRGERMGWDIGEHFDV